MNETAVRTPSALRKFGFIVGGGLTLLAAISWYRGHYWVPVVMWSAGGVLLLLALVLPRALGPFEKAWMTFGTALGWINTRIILTLLFALIVTPLGAVMRLFHDPLDRKLEKKDSSYWLPRKTVSLDPKTYERQF